MVVEVGQWHAMTAAPMALGYPGHAIVMEISGHRFDPALALTLTLTLSLSLSLSLSLTLNLKP